MENVYDPPHPMTKEQKELIEQENKWRQLFAEDPGNELLQDLHLGLIKVWDNNNNQFNYEKETQVESVVPKLLTQHRRLDLQGSSIVDQSEFLKNWKEFTQGCLEGINWDNIFVAGGAILGCLSSSQDGYRGSDIDLFLYGIDSDSQASEKLRTIYDKVVSNTGGRGDVIRTDRALTILCPYPFRHVQIILRLYKSPAEVLLGFDIDSCCVGFDNKEVWCMERFRRALTKRYNLVNVSRRSITYEQRLFKYSKRGFAVAVPNLDKSRVNPDICTKTIRDVKGLAKLILYDYNQNNGKSNFSRPSRKARRAPDEEGSDYNNDLPIPWGPEWQTDAIINLLNTKNKAKFFSTLKRNQKQQGVGVDVTQAGGGQTTEKTSTSPTTTISKPYNHLFISNAEKLKSGNFSVWKRSLDGVDVQRPIEWIKDNPAYQDFDNGFRRLMTGSFEPTCDDNWEEGVYVSPDQATTTTAGALREAIPLSTNYSSATDKGSPVIVKGLSLVSSPKPFVPFTSTSTSEGLKQQEAGGGTAAPVVPPPSEKKLEFPKPPNWPSGGVYTGSTDVSVFGGAGFGVASGIFSQPADVSQFSGIFTGSTDVSAFGGGGTFGLQPSSSTATSEFTFPGAASDLPIQIEPYSRTKKYPTKSPLKKKLESKVTVEDEDEESVEEKNKGKGKGRGAAFDKKREKAKLFAQKEHKMKSAGGREMESSSSIFGPQPGMSMMQQQQQRQQQQQKQRTLEKEEPVQFFGRYHYPHVASSSSDMRQPPPVVLKETGTTTTTPSTTLPSQNTTTKLLLLIALSYKQGRITNAEKGKLKDLTLISNSLVCAALDVFEIDQDLEELTDTFKRICRLSN